MGTRERQSRCPPRSPRTASAKKPTANRGGASAAESQPVKWTAEHVDPKTLSGAINITDTGNEVATLTLPCGNGRDVQEAQLPD
jgi:hypothetical protein